MRFLNCLRKKCHSAEAMARKQEKRIAKEEAKKKREKDLNLARLEKAERKRHRHK